MVSPLEQAFPNLAAGGYAITSPADKKYNCIAYAVGDTERWWWPTPPGTHEAFWPAGAQMAETIAAFRDAFASLGFADSNGATLQPGLEKIALFANDQGFPLHAARQLPSGRWTSKLGEREDIEHTLDGLEGGVYGKVVLVMRRPRDLPS